MLGAGLLTLKTKRFNVSTLQLFNVSTLQRFNFYLLPSLADMFKYPVVKVLGLKGFQNIIIDIKILDPVVAF